MVYCRLAKVGAIRYAKPIARGVAGEPPPFVTSRHLVQLLLLAAIWGGSFPFMRAAAAPFGPVPLIFVRMLVAALCLAPFCLLMGGRPGRGAAWWQVTLIALVMCVTPFTLLAYASLSLTAGFTSLLNAVTPLMTALVGRAIWQQRLAWTQWLGIIVGMAGVGFLCQGQVSFKPGGTGWAVVAALGATLCYGVGGHLGKRWLAHRDPRVTTAGTMIAGSAWLALPGIILWPATNPALPAWLAVLLLGAGCTAVAYVLYYRLLSQVGPTQVASVTFLVPAFSLVWSALFLGERIGARILGAFAVILLGTALTNRVLRWPGQSRSARVPLTSDAGARDGSQPGPSA